MFELSIIAIFSSTYNAVKRLLMSSTFAASPGLPFLVINAYTQIVVAGLSFQIIPIMSLNVLYVSSLLVISFGPWCSTTPSGFRRRTGFR